MAEQYTGRQKAAMLLLFIGPELAAKVFQKLDDEQIDILTLELARLQNVDRETLESVVREFYDMYQANEYIAQGGIKYAQEILEKALGQGRASEVIARLTSSFRVRPFDIARSADPSQLLNLIQNEHPQTIALIMGYLQPEKAAAILKALPSDIQAEVAKRLAMMDRTSPETIRDVEAILEKKLSVIIGEDYTTVGGVETVVDILNLVDRGTEKSIIEVLETDNPELAEEIKRRMFVFEDITLIDDRGVQRVLREIDMKDLALALRAASEEVKAKFFSNMSKRAGQMLQEDMEFLGPVRLRDVEDAQQKIVNVIRKLEDAGEIVISRGGTEETIV